MSGRLMVNLILMQDIRAWRVAGTKIKPDIIYLRHKSLAGGRHQN